MTQNLSRPQRLRSAVAVGIAFSVTIVVVGFVTESIVEWAGPVRWTLVLIAFLEGAKWGAAPAILLVAWIQALAPGREALEVLTEPLGLLTYSGYGLIVGFVWPTPLVDGRPRPRGLIVRCGLLVLLVWSLGAYALLRTS